MLHASQLRPLHKSAQQRFLICLFVYLFIYSFFHYRHIGYGIRASTMFFMRTRNNTTKCVVQQDNLFLVLVCLRHSLWILHDYAPWLHAFVLCFGFPVYVRYVIPTSVEEGLKKKKNTNCLLLKIGNLWAKDGMCELRCARNLAISFPLFSSERDK